jgi:5-methylcytosine-specific restriction endonuclease McrA
VPTVRATRHARLYCREKALEMAFSDEVANAAWRRAGGKCECTRLNCGHSGRCNAALTANNWHAHHRTAVVVGGADTLSNCEALCIPCHRKTASYGRS